jgi:hypothetical protein
LTEKGGNFGGDDVFRQLDQIFGWKNYVEHTLASLVILLFMTTPYNVTISHPEAT